jgi:ATP adenylyltransferase
MNNNNGNKEQPHYLYSPWRLDYILGEKPGDCILCRYQNSVNDEENLILHRAKNSYIMLNRYPYNNGHLMIIPYRHCAALADLDTETWQEMTALLRDAEVILKKVYNCDGINIGINLGCAAGAGIAEHLHIHIVPRWKGDSNFMSVIGGERVIPEPFEVTFQKLAPEFANLIKNQEDIG